MGHCRYTIICYMRLYVAKKLNPNDDYIKTYLYKLYSNVTIMFENTNTFKSQRLTVLKSKKLPKPLVNK